MKPPKGVWWRQRGGYTHARTHTHTHTHTYKHTSVKGIGMHETTCHLSTTVNNACLRDCIGGCDINPMVAIRRTAHIIIRYDDNAVKYGLWPWGAPCVWIVKHSIAAAYCCYVPASWPGDLYTHLLQTLTLEFSTQRQQIIKLKPEVKTKISIRKTSRVNSWRSEA